MLNKINFQYQESENQNELFTTHHTKYKCKISYNDKQFSFDYQCNPNYTMPSKLDCVRAIILDMEAYDYNQSYNNFLWEYGYTDGTTARKVFNACKRTSDRLHKMFTFDELDELAEETRE